MHPMSTMGMPTSPIECLSNELTISILEYLHLPERGPHGQIDLSSCMFVNHKWHNLAYPLLWRSIHLDLHWHEYHKSSRNTSNETRAPQTGPTFYDKLPGAGMWGNDFSETTYTNKLGVRPTQLDIVSNPRTSFLEHCRYLTIIIDRNDISDLVSIIRACNNVRHVDILVCVTEPSRKFRNCLRQITHHLSSVPLSTLRIKFSCPVPAPSFLDLQSRIHQQFLRSYLTHLSVTHPIVNIDDILQQLSYPNLRSFTYVLGEVRTNVPAKYFSPSENETFWNAVQAVPLEELGFSVPYAALTWDGGYARFPSTLKKLIVTLDESLAFNPIPILQQVTNLQTLVIKQRNFWRNDDRWITVDGDNWEEVVPIPYETIACHQLRTLHLHANVTPTLLHTIFSQCPLIDDVVFPQDTGIKDMLVIMEHCPSIKRVAFDSSAIGKEGLRNLVRLQSLLTISLVVFQLEDILYNQIAILWAREIPSLRRVICLADERKKCPIGAVKRYFSTIGQSLQMDADSVRWFTSFLRDDKSNGDVYLDMQALRSDPEGSLRFERVNRTRRLSYTRERRRDQQV